MPYYPPPASSSTAWSYGTLGIGSGGTASSTALNNSRVMVSSSGTIAESNSITDGDSVQLNNTTFISAPLPVGTCEGRLTATSGGVPVTTSDVTNQTTLFFTPYKGNRVALFDATRWRMYTFSEMSIPLVTSTSSNYDVFIWDSSGTLSLQLSTVWSNNTTRQNTLVLQNGVYLNNSAEGSMPLKTGKYLGTIRGNSANSVEDSDSRRFIWNNYNRVPKRIYKVDSSTASWTYGTASWRSANADTSLRVQIVHGLAEEFIELKAGQTTGPNVIFAGIGEDSTTSNIAGGGSGGGITIFGDPSGAANAVDAAIAIVSKVPTVGFHFYQWIENAASGILTTNFNFAAGNRQSGLLGIWRC